MFPIPSILKDVFCVYYLKSKQIIEEILIVNKNIFFGLKVLNS